MKRERLVSSICRVATRISTRHQQAPEFALPALLLLPEQVDIYCTVLVQSLSLSLSVATHYGGGIFFILFRHLAILSHY